MRPQTYALRVILESPYAARDERLLAANIEYARMCVRNSLMRHEAPLAFHLLYTQPRVLQDTDPEQRALGMAMSQQWYEVADLVAVYTDRGVSKGMQIGIDLAKRLGLRIEYRKLLEPSPNA